MEDKDLTKEVTKIVDNLFSDKEEAEIRKRTEVALKESADTIISLTSELESKNTEVVELGSKLSDKDNEIQVIKSELEAARKELEVANEDLAKSKQELEGIVKDRAAEKRMAELIGAGVASSDKENQMNKVRDFSDEEFASYRDELVSLREAVKAELEKARLDADANAKAEAEEAAKKEAKKKADDEEMVVDPKTGKPVMDPKTGKPMMKKKAAAEEITTEDNTEGASDTNGETVTTPVQITPGQAVTASLNAEFKPSESVTAKYNQLGKALADRWKKGL